MGREGAGNGIAAEVGTDDVVNEPYGGEVESDRDTIEGIPPSAHRTPEVAIVDSTVRCTWNIVPAEKASDINPVARRVRRRV